jgi:ubiquinone/menaquinone biosynthesis C-methylase UbiE
VTDRSVDLFEKQYGQGKLTYQQGVPGLRRLLKDHLHTRIDVAARALRTLGGGALLDYGCGDGELVFRVCDAFTACQGLDVVPARIAAAESRAAAEGSDHSGSIAFSVCAPDGPVPAADGTYDVVVCIAVLPWIYDVYGILREFHRVLKPGGHVVVEVANAAYIRRRLRLLVGGLPTTTPTDIAQWPDIGWDAACLHQFTRATLRTFLEQCGFTVTTVEPTGLLGKALPFWPGLFATGFVAVGRRS